MLVTGSIYLLSDLVRGGPRRERSAPMTAAPSAHAGLVAAVVATVILVFFAIGYGLGSLLL